jgi:hypothetical protein
MEDDGTGRKRRVVDVENARVNGLERKVDEEGYIQHSGYDRRGIPSDSFTTRPGMIEWSGSPLKDPVWVDLLTGRIYAYPKNRISIADGEVYYLDVPVYDSPCILTERKLLVK